MTIERLLVLVNKVTAYHRHGNNIPKKALDKLCNAQIELETKLQNTSSNSDYMSPSAQLKKLAENQKSLTPEMIDVINDNFWELF